MRRVTDPHGFLWMIDEAGALTTGSDGERSTVPMPPPAIWLRISAPGERARIIAAPAHALEELTDAELRSLVARALQTDGPASGGRE
jgi:hypothetical protein